MKFNKYFIVFLIWLTVQSFNISAQLTYKEILPSRKSAIFQESFDNNSNNWFLDNLWIRGNVVNGYYDITCRNHNGSTGLSYKPVPIDKEKDYEIEAAIKTLKGTGGLVFGMTDKYDHYRIEISGNKLEIFKDAPTEKKLDKIYSGKVNSSSKSGSYDKITIRKQKGIFYIFFNESLINGFNKIKPEGDQVGFNVGLNSEISVDYLNISYLTNQNAPITAERNFVKDDSSITLKNSPNTFLQKELINSKRPAAPLIKWISPSEPNINLDTYTARIKVNINSGSELKAVLFYVNGSSKGEGEIKSLPGENGIYVVEKIITLNPGENNVYLVATNFEGTSKSDLRYFTNPIATPPEIRWGIPVESNAMVNTETFTMEVCIKTLADLVSAKVLVDGVQVTVGKVFQRSELDNCNYTWKPQIILKEGDNSIYVIAENVAGSTTSENRIIKFNKSIAERRLALVFGNSEYLDGTRLKNPVNDANLMEATLKSLGFDVIKRLNAGKDSMFSSIREFSKRLSDYNVALFYYAGHGIQVDGINYLIPTNAKLDNKEDCKWEAVSVSTVTDEFKKNSANTNIVILDACRNNPFRSWARGEEQGFKALAPINGTIISFSTSEGTTAADGDGANGLFTEVLVKQMVVPQQIESVFKKTRKEVIERSNGQQTPTEWSYLTGDFYFKK